jgi:hypothetical protein
MKLDQDLLDFLSKEVVHTGADSHEEYLRALIYENWVRLVTKKRVLKEQAQIREYRGVLRAQKSQL